MAAHLFESRLEQLPPLQKFGHWLLYLEDRADDLIFYTEYKYLQVLVSSFSYSGKIGSRMILFNFTLGYLWKCPLWFRNKKRFHHQALIEVKILDHLRRKDRDKHHNIIHMLDYFYFRNHLCITFELMGWANINCIKHNFKK